MGSPGGGAGSPSAKGAGGEGDKDRRKDVHHEEATLERFCVPAIGTQWQSKRYTAPKYSISKCTRAMRDKVFISKEASASAIPADTPGPIYDGVIKSTLNLQTGQKFGTGPQRTFGRWKHKYDWEQDTKDHMGLVTERHNRQRYKKQAEVVFTQTPIGLTNNIEIFKAHPIAFQGLDSPGPHQYPCPKIEHTSKYASFPKMPFGIKNDNGSMYAVSKHGNPNVGPNSYPPMVSLGTQRLSQRRNATTNLFPKAPKFGREVKSDDDGATNLEMNLSSFGRQVKGSKKTEPLVGFSLGTRSQAQRMTRCMDKKDAPAPPVKIRLPHPTIPQEKKYIAISGSMGSFM